MGEGAVTSSTSAGPLPGFKDPETLGRLYTTLGSAAAVAKHFGVSKPLILTHLKRFGIERGPAGLNRGQRTEINAQECARLLAEGYTLASVAEWVGLSQPTLRRRLQAAGFESDQYHRGKVRKWNGYRKKYKPGHPRADGKGYVMEHTLVMERHIGRYLADGEVVHHINRDPSDNRLENLQLMDEAEHRRMHSRQPRRKRKT